MPHETTPTWPPSDEELDWRPESYDFDETLPVTALRRDGKLPDWAQVADDISEEDLEEVELPSLTLAYIELESTLSDTLWVTAVQDPEGGFRLVVHDEYETAFAPPISHATEPLKLGELIRILDETVWEEEEDMAGIGHAFRDRCTQGDQTRAECVDFVAVRSKVYPQLEALDAARGRSWAQQTK